MPVPLLLGTSSTLASSLVQDPFHTIMQAHYLRSLLTPSGRECWTGNNLNPLQTLASDPSTCNRQCAGNGGQICGGPDRLNLYIRRGQPGKVCQRVANPDVDTLACGIRGFAPPAGARPATPTVDSAAKCAAACAAATGCQSSIWNKTTGLCRIYDVSVWLSIGNVAQFGAGRDHKDVFADDIGCWTCQDGA